jgi:hypothetical protein
MSRVLVGATRNTRPNLSTFKGNYTAETKRRLVTLTFASWNQIANWLSGLDAVQRAA